MSYTEKPDEITKDEWMEKLNNLHVQRADMNRLIMNYLVTEGFKEAAEKFRMESGIEPSVDLETLDERIKIREMILKGQIQEAIALINSLHPELLDTNRFLYFHLQQQHLIELIRQRETEAALEFAQTQLAEQGEESRECLTEMERTLALLAFDNPEESPFGDLLHMMQRQKVWSEVNQAVLDYENREHGPSKRWRTCSERHGVSGSMTQTPAGALAEGRPHRLPGAAPVGSAVALRPPSQASDEPWASSCSLLARKRTVRVLGSAEACQALVEFSLTPWFFVFVFS
uniref:GID complex subunit 8 homolog n=1 Tax=Suricata suricatta TaxID=37032 RepID=A0A673UI16_SURSU